MFGAIEMTCYWFVGSFVSNIPHSLLVVSLLKYVEILSVEVLDLAVAVFLSTFVFFEIFDDIGDFSQHIDGRLLPQGLGGLLCHK